MRLLVVAGLAERALACSFLIANWQIERAALDHAAERLIPRGPDGTNVVHPEGWTIMHNLLHMHGDKRLQPFADAANRTFAVFNGELYNYRAFKPSATSDGQALLPAYRAALRTLPRPAEVHTSHPKQLRQQRRVSLRRSMANLRSSLWIFPRGMLSLARTPSQQNLSSLHTINSLAALRSHRTPRHCVGLAFSGKTSTRWRQIGHGCSACPPPLTHRRSTLWECNWHHTKRCNGGSSRTNSTPTTGGAPLRARSPSEQRTPGLTCPCTSRSLTASIQGSSTA